MSNNKLLIIGLDGATWKLLKQWIDDGSMPNLAKLYAGGSRGTLLSTVPSVTCPALPSLFTGKNPGNVGIFDFVDPYGSPVRLKDIRAKKMWNVLQDNGMSSVIVDLRFTYPTEPLDGVMIAGSPMPAEIDSSHYPPDLEEKLGRKIRLLPLFRKHFEYAADIDGNKEKYLASLRDYAEERYSLVKQISSWKKYDLIFTWYGDVDSVSHAYWYDMEAIKKHLKLVDDHIGRYTRDFPDNNIMILSDHGFHKEASTRFFVNMWLKQEGFLKTRGGPLMQWLYKVTVRTFTKIFGKKTLLKFLSPKQKLEKGQKGDKIVLGDNYRNILPGVDWKITKAYFRKPWGIQIIRENLDGDYEDFREKLIQRMRQLIDNEGKRIFAHVWKKEEVFTGKYLSQIPDIIYQLCPGYNPDYIISSGPLIQPKVRYFKDTWLIKMTGNHVMDREGIFLGYGPDFRQDMDLTTANIEDIAPTVYHMLGCPSPDDLDGKIIMEALSDELRNKEIKYYTPEPPLGSGKIEKSSAEEDESIKQQLRNMGYLQD